MQFFLCASCARHVKSNEAACPFCGALTPSANSASVTGRPDLQGIRDRSALLFGVAVAAVSAGALAACHSSSSSDDSANHDPSHAVDGGAHHQGPVTIYGAPGIDGDRMRQEMLDSLNGDGAAPVQNPTPSAPKPAQSR